MGDFSTIKKASGVIVSEGKWTQRLRYGWESFLMFLMAGLLGSTEKMHSGCLQVPCNRNKETGRNVALCNLIAKLIKQQQINQIK